VLSAKPWREAGRIYSILTRDLGLIRASATGVRNESSKLRALVEPISFVSVSLVRGKEYWRLTSAEFIKKVSSSESLLKPLALLEKLVQGESKHSELFDAVEQYLDSDEITLVSQILYHLGYLRKSDLELEKKELIKAINHGLENSHLM